MTPPLALVKWLLGILCIFFCYYLGRSMARRFVHRDLQAPMARRAFRAILAGLGLLWSGGFDASAWLVLASAVVAGAIGFHHERLPKRTEEDLSKVIFPNE
jgi:NhaP-type Na+/H+ or K+/H+ antiporter